jgi:hypothetical protein
MTGSDKSSHSSFPVDTPSATPIVFGAKWSALAAMAGSDTSSRSSIPVYSPSLKSIVFGARLSALAAMAKSSHSLIPGET